MNVAITGFMGAGKTTAGRRLARLLHVPFVDTDAEIERVHGPISEIFAHDGEAAFREHERGVIDRFSGPGPRVIAVGGGAVLDPVNRRALRRNGLIVYLALKPESAYRRVAHRTHRPLLGAAPTVETIRSLLAARSAAYADNDLSIAVDEKTALAVAHIIARWYRRRAQTVEARAR
jgi:shikimate kinase